MVVLVLMLVSQLMDYTFVNTFTFSNMADVFVLSPITIFNTLAYTIKFVYKYYVLITQARFKNK